MKIALNLADLSPKAIRAYANAIGQEAYFFVRKYRDERGVEDHHNDRYELISLEDADNDYWIVFNTPDLEYEEYNTGRSYPAKARKLKEGFYDDHVIHLDDHNRLDPVMISVIESLGDEAGAYVVDVPDDVKWHIESSEESCKEWVAEDHRTWG